MKNTVWQFATAGSLHFGRGCRNRLSDELAKRQLSRPLVVTDSTVASLPAVKDILQALSSPVLFDGGQAEPTTDVAEQAIALGVESAVDCVVGIGGGSNLDVAKIAAVVVRHGGQPSDYFGFDLVPSPILPVFALPTTAGTGSEVSHSAVLTDSSQQVKVSTLSVWLRPSCALVDPELSSTCPRRVTAESGIDALVHAIEAYTNRDFAQMVDIDPQAKAYEGSYGLTRMLAAEAIRLIGRSLTVACDDLQNARARDDMALAATLAGMAFSNSGVGLVHALEYPIGALTHCGHGEGNGLLLPHVMRYNLPECLAGLAEIASLLECATDGRSTHERAELAIEWVVQLQREIGIRRQLSELGMQEADVAHVASKAFEIKRLMDVNARKPTESDLRSILMAAL